MSAALLRDVNEKLAIMPTVQSSNDHVIKLHPCCTKIAKSEKIILFRTLWVIDFYVELSMMYTPRSDVYPVLQNAVEL